MRKLINFKLKDEVKWECNLIKISDFVSDIVDNRGKTPPVIESGVPLIEVNALGSRNVNYDKVTKFLKDDIFKNFLRKYLKKNDILFSTVGNTAVTSLFNGSCESAIAQNIVGLRINECHDANYIYQMFSFKNNVDTIKKIQMNGVQPSIKVTQLIEVKLKIHRDIDQQIKIGNLLSSIDNLIELSNEEIKELELKKKYYLNEIFS